MKPKTLILVRHAHRDTSEGRDRDNGLSAKGQAQAKAIAKHYLDTVDKAAKVALVSSPATRCIETLLPLSDALGVQVRLLPSLGERRGSVEEFEKRLQVFLRWWRQRAPEVTVACSHGDWIPAFTAAALGAEIELKKGGWLEIEKKETLRVRWVHQKL